MLFRPSKLIEGDIDFRPSRLVEWFDSSPLIEADPPKDADEEERERKKKKKQEKPGPGGEKKGPDKPGEADQAPPAPVEPRERGGPPAAPMKPVKMPPIEKEKPPHDLSDIQKKSEKIVDPTKGKPKTVTPQARLKRMVRARADRRDDIQDLAQSGLGAHISMRMSPRSRYSGY